MKKKLLLYCGLVSAGHSWSQSIALSTLNSSGGTAVHSSGIYDWSIGEMALVSTFSTSNLIVTQGLLQIELLNVSVNDNPTPSLGIQVFPNPSQDAIYISSELKTDGKMMYNVIDVLGKTILTGEWNIISGSQKQQVDVSTLIAGNYLLQITVLQGLETRVESYKLLKN
jgi:hypothetical protein